MPEQSDSQTVLIHPEHFIPLPRHYLKGRLLAQGDEAAQVHWEQFFELLEALLHFQYHRQVLEMKEDYLVLHPSAPLPSYGEEKIRQAEERFLEHFFAIMEKADFHPLSREDLETARCEDFMYMLPLQIDWDQLDGEFLERFHRTRGGSEDCPGEFEHKLLLFARGTGLERTSGYFFLAKLDLVVSNLLESVFSLPGRVVQGMKSLLGRGKGRGEPELEATSAEEAPSKKQPEHIHAPQRVQRISLRHAVRSWRALFRPVVLQEPTYRELVMVYRLKSESEESRLAHRPAPIHIKLFHDIPHADLEVVFPAKRISMKPVDLVKLVVTGCVGLVLAASKLIFSAVLNPVLMLTAVATVAGYGFKLIFQFRASVNRYHQLVTDAMYAKNRDNDLGVILSLMEEVEEQEFREAVLAYWMLVHRGPLSAGELDGCCERWLRDQFGIRADFDVADALEKLARLGLAHQHEDRWHAVPLEEALRELDRAWDNFFPYYSPQENTSQSRLSP